MKPMHETRYLRFYLQEELKKTNVYAVKNRTGVYLGHIKWFGRWRQYCFEPDHDTVYAPECLFDIMEFIRARMAERAVKKSG